ncbi:retrovirus polyprotein [Purpureocillium lavendulum]|uniref:Retrovirus polyprotein n=1 Tax=Purpureocillium lavendulum TaxID=1247861 RepID=A0AB34FE89_9HYPO|nr:retrovirus polyprotein [Purpureocillium lavendulum]
MPNPVAAATEFFDILTILLRPYLANDSNSFHSPIKSEIHTPDRTSAEVYAVVNPREHIAEWRWRGTIAAICLTSMISGYDVSNVATIQTRLHEALGHIELLEWISLSFSLAVFASLSLARKIVYCFNLRWIYLVHLAVFFVGSALAGAAPNMATVIIGRSIMGVGGAVILQINMSYLAEFATAVETPRLVACSSASWAIGLAVGGPIGSAFAEQSTWRWAFYLNLPLVAVAFFLAATCAPAHILFDAVTPLQTRIRHIDPVGIAFNAIVPELFAVAVTFSGPIWEWNSAGSIALWIVFGGTLMLWATQQYLCVFTTRQERALPLHMLSRLDLLPLWIASACAGSIYAITLIYTPLFFAFTRGADALRQSLLLLPFTIPFIVALLLTGALLPVVRRHKPFYIAGGIVTAASSAAMVASLADRTSSDARIMGLEALIGLGLGMLFQHGVGICNVINKKRRRSVRVDGVALCNLAQFGGIAVTLAIAGSVFQNVGFSLLEDAVGSASISKHEIREALSGVSSTLWREPELSEVAVLEAP